MLKFLFGVMLLVLLAPQANAHPRGVYHCHESWEWRWADRPCHRTLGMGYGYRGYDGYDGRRRYRDRERDGYRDRERAVPPPDQELRRDRRGGINITIQRRRH